MRSGLLFVCLVLFALPSAFARQPARTTPADQASAIAEGLVARGFEHVEIVRVDGRLSVTLENRSFRYDMRALDEALAIIEAHVPPEQAYDATLLILGLPAVAARRPVGQDEAAPVAYSILPRGRISAASTLVPRQRPTTFTFDLVVHPQFAASLGNFDDPFEMQLNVAPELTTSLWRGMELSAQLIIPVYNELAESDDGVRPGLLTLAQYFRPSPTTLANVTVGYFTSNRYGVDASIRRYMLEGRLALGARVGRTGFLDYGRRQWRYGDLDRLLYRAEARYYVLPRLSFWLGASYGRFLAEDTGWRVDLHRRFGEVEVQLFAVTTNRGENAGLEISLPLPPFRQAPPRPVRVRPSRSFTWYYVFDKLEPAGGDYRTGSSLDDFWDGIEPGSLRSDLDAVSR